MVNWSFTVVRCYTGCLRASCLIHAIAQSETLNLQTHNGQTTYGKRRPHHNLCSQQPRKLTQLRRSLAENGQNLVDGSQLPLFLPILLTQDQPEKTKYAPQTNHIGCSTLISAPLASLCQPSIRTHLNPSLFPLHRSLIPHGLILSLPNAIMVVDSFALATSQSIACVCSHLGELTYFCKTWNPAELSASFAIAETMTWVDRSLPRVLYRPTCCLRPFQSQGPLLPLRSLCSLSFALTTKWYHSPADIEISVLLLHFYWWLNLNVQGFPVCPRKGVPKPGHTLRTTDYLPGALWEDTLSLMSQQAGEEWQALPTIRN